MPFYNPLWAKKQSATTGYLTLGMYPITVNITGSQTEVGSSTNTIEASYASHTEDYWKTERIIPAYTYFTLGSNPVNENTVTPVEDPEVANVPGGTQQQGNNEILNWSTSVSSWSANKEYDGNALISHNGNYTDILADTSTTVTFTSVPVTIDSNTIWYSGNSPVVINYSGLRLNEGTLVVSDTGSGTGDLIAKAIVTPGSVRVGGSAFWATLYGYGNVDDADDESSSYVNFGSGTTNQLIRYFFRQELAGAKTLVMAGFSGGYVGMTASITVNGNTYTTTVTSNEYNYKGFNGTSIGSVASWVDGTLWEDLAALSSPYTVTITLSVSSE